MLKHALAVTYLSCNLAFTAHACEGQKVLFEDQFQDTSGGWEILADRTEIKDSSLRITPQMSRSFVEINNGFFFDSADMCVDVTFGGQDAGDWGGLIFWFDDYENYFAFQVTPTGWYGIQRLFKGKWSMLADAESPAVKRGAGATNTVRVTAKGNLLTFYINGQRIRQMKGQPPKQEWQFGVQASSSKEHRATTEFKNVKVTDTP